MGNKDWVSQQIIGCRQQHCRLPAHFDMAAVVKLGDDFNQFIPHIGFCDRVLLFPDSRAYQTFCFQTPLLFPYFFSDLPTQHQQQFNNSALYTCYKLKIIIIIIIINNNNNNNNNNISVDF